MNLHRRFAPHVILSVRRFQGDEVARVSVKAVLAGVVVEFVLSIVLGILVVFVWGLAASRGKPVAADAQVATDTGLLLIFLVIGLSALVLGFVAARIAGRDHVILLPVRGRLVCAQRGCLGRYAAARDRTQ